MLTSSWNSLWVVNPVPDQAQVMHQKVAVGLPEVPWQEVYWDCWLATRKSGKWGGMLAYGGAAAAGALAFKAYQNWQQGKQVATAPVATEQDMAQVDARFLPQQASATASAGNFSLTLVMAMIAAAKADGHIDAKEQTHIFEQVEQMSLDSESKGFVFDALRQPADLAQLASGVQGIEQAAEVYLVSRSVLDVDHPAERAYLQALAHRLDLPADLVAHLDHQVTGE